MHELGIIMSIVRIAERAARENDAHKVNRLVLQVGARSCVVPHLVHAGWPAAIEGTLLEGAELIIEEASGDRDVVIKEIEVC